MKKKLFCILLAVCVVFCSAPIVSADIFDKDLWSDTYLVIDIRTGEVLASSNAGERRYPASLTKMLTAIVVYEYVTNPENTDVSLDTVVRADAEDSEVEPTKFGLRPGEEMTVDEALNIMLLRSANDIASMLAKQLFGSYTLFAKAMNEKAAEIGCEDSHFVTPNGLHDDDHYSTASDLAKIALYLLDNEYLANIVKQPSYDYEETNKHNAGTVYNTNQLMEGDSSIYVGAQKTLTKYDKGDVFGVKTGTTPEAGGCLVAAVENEHTQILIVILNSRSSEDSYNLERYSDAHQLLDWAFSSYGTYIAMTAGHQMDELKVRKGEFNRVRTEMSEDIFITLPSELSSSSVRTETVWYSKTVKAPFDAGTKVGRVDVYVADEKVGSYAVVTSEGISEGGVLSVFGIEDATAHKIFKTLGIFLAIILVLGTALIITRQINKRKARIRREKREKRKAELERLRRARWGEEYDKRYDQASDRSEQESGVHHTKDDVQH